MEKWIKMVISADTTQVDAISDYLIGMIGAAVETGVNSVGQQSVVNAFLERQGRSTNEIEELVSSVRQYLKEISTAFNGVAGVLSWELVDDQDWASAWQQYFTPFEIIPGLVIAPTWENYEAGPGEKVIVMDPGMAFGTGHHATTALSLELIALELKNSGCKSGVLDVGTGTGILAMAAALFGCQRAVAIDNDPEAVDIARINIAQNGLSGLIKVETTPLSELQESFSLVVANIVHDVIVEMIPDLSARAMANGAIIISGLIHGAQSDNIIRLFTEKGWRLKEQRRREEWAALLFGR